MTRRPRQFRPGFDALQDRVLLSVWEPPVPPPPPPDPQGIAAAEVTTIPSLTTATTSAL